MLSQNLEALFLIGNCGVLDPDNWIFPAIAKHLSFGPTRSAELRVHFRKNERRQHKVQALRQQVPGNLRGLLMELIFWIS